MGRKLIFRTLVLALAIGLATQVLFGQVLCDLLTAMPCCMGDERTTAPPVPTSTNACCFIAAPEVTSNFLAVSKTTSDQSPHTPTVSGLAEHVVISPAAAPEIPHDLQFLPSPFNRPEKLSTFRI